MKRMLVNATQQEELRVALVDGQRLYDLSIDLTAREQRKANVYKGRIARIEPSLEACFVDYGAERHGFLPLKEISREYFLKNPSGGGRVSMREVLQEGQDIVVQVEKEERGNKGAALTTYISLAGRFLVLMPNNPRAGGVSRRIEGEDRDQMKSIMDALNIPARMGAIVRTAGVGRATEELQWDLDNLKIQWDEIVKAVLARPSPFLVYRESDPVTRALRDYLSDDISEVLVDEPKAYAVASEYMQRFMPAEGGRRLRMYSDDIPLFTRYQIESQIESAYAHKVQLPSGGSIVIDYTEALVSIDINSARATRGGDIETTATITNLEAADEIARQLRIRDIGGLIVIDFIDMDELRNQRAVEDRLREVMKMDRARIQIGRLSRFGLLEMSRQRLRPSLSDSSHEVCPRCQGIGSIRTVESMALAILRLVGEEARKDRTSKVIVEVPVEVATYLINEKREWLRTLEDKSDIELIVIPNLNIHTPEYSIRRVRNDETESTELKRLSYQMPTPAKVPDATSTREKQLSREPAAVSTFLPTTPAPIVAHAATLVVAAPAASATAGSQLGIFVRLWRWLFGAPKPVEPVREGRTNRRRDRDRDRDRDRVGRGRDRDRNGREAQGGDRGNHGRDRNRDRREQGKPQDAKPAVQNERRDERQDESQGRGRDEGRREKLRRDDGRRRVRNDRSPRDPERAAAPAPAQDAAVAPLAHQAQGSGENANPTAAEGASSADGTPSLREDGARRGRRRGRRGRRGGMRDLPAGSADQAVTDFSDTGDDVGKTPSFASPATSDTSLQGASTKTASSSAPAPIDLPLLPQSSGNISWTGLSTPQTGAKPTETSPAEAAPTEVSTFSESSRQDAAPAAPRTPDELESSVEKKVVWSSGPLDRHSSFGGTNRRDDY
ncbi:MAG: Rne/Rng family ribonuclease [Gammaproteobacteria bacterium]|nr:Rne/Rng family ribonuclease [Gammaproteobacteria bacterium]